MNPDMNAPVVLIVDEHRKSRDTMRTILSSDGFEIVEADSPDGALSALNHNSPDIIILDFNLRGGDGLELAGNVKRRLPNIPIISVTEQRDTRVLVQAVRRGIYDYLLKPINADDLRLSISQALEEKRLKDELNLLKGQLEERATLVTRMGNSDKVQALVRLLEKIAPTPFTVLIEGESGAGKELVARAIHDMSKVRGNSFVAVDCGAIPETLFESELFGHAKGAFTGAATNKAGVFEAADNGTLFLDEICNLSYTSQQKLLRAIEDRTVQRLGTTSSRRVNVRIIAASNRSLEKDVENRLFRVDLLHRLKEVSVKIPALRERQEDIAYLANRFLDEFKAQLGLRCTGISRSAMAVLMNDYSWPGNVRELRNVMRQAALTCEDDRQILPGHLPLPLAGGTSQSNVWMAKTTFDLETESLADIIKRHSRELERKIIEQALKEANGNKVVAARRLRIDYKTLHRKRKTLRLS
ncbi:MAG: sigma-54 dependent transcriptional regulator [Planctomycetota bacterium]|jgi:DNA-binding NtrC family response regulator|nr:sigma-54 dependent transcriptional regulator [Planctomycetota bacterium]